MSAEEYEGPAQLVLGAAPDDTLVDVEVRLRSLFHPIDGRRHWYGRVAPDPRLDVLTPGAEVLLRTPRGAAPARLSDRDPWGRYRVSGTGRPPFDA
jgi:hypothetical protein